MLRGRSRISPSAPYPRGVFRRLALASAAALALAACAPSSEAVDLPDSTAFENQILEQVNVLRFDQNVNRLDPSDCLADHARERAVGLLGAVEAPTEDLPADCGDYDYAGENVSRSDQTATEVVETWAGEDTQAPNLVDEQFEIAGVGCVPVAAADNTRVAEDGEGVAGMACSIIFQGFSP